MLLKEFHRTQELHEHDLGRLRDELAELETAAQRPEPKLRRAD
jgi:hypothetical protein